MQPLLLLAVPPLLGAFIGYATNYIAIRMLFRPLRPWRLLGWQLPMTPGVIPKKRGELAENIGKMVGQHLLTSTEVGRAIHGPSFQREIRTLIDNRLAVLLQKELGPFPSLVPQRFRSYFDSSVRILRWRLLKHLHTYLDGEEFATLLRGALNSRLNEFLAGSLDSRLPEAQRHKLYSVLESVLHGLLTGKAMEGWLRQAVAGQVEEILARQRSLHDLLPVGLTEALLHRLEQETPGLLRKMAAQLQEPVVQDRIARAVSQSAAGFIQRLGPLAAMLQGFLRPEVIDEKIRSHLKEKGEEISEWLFDQTVQQKVTGLLREKAAQWLQTPLSAVLEKVEPQTVSRLQDGFTDHLLRIVQDPTTAKRFAKMVAESLEQQADRPLKTLLGEWLGEEELHKGKEWLEAELLRALRNPDTRKMLDGLVIELERRLLNRPVGALADYLPQEVQRGMGEYLLQQLNDIMVREVPGLVDSLNIQQIVARKVNSLDLLRLEGLLMGIMEEQFKYINLFGGLLGFLIGLLNLAVLAFS